ncbi:2-hydroxyacid dehydrogenase [Oligella urethralis]|uniref:2-hydroxyacid dehydrogenase n=1 Tax=Oligella urethralis TaxID=90245 RepID=UPI00288C23D5|nr:2-hydroxyacid dehydrogenase [Oligella urethralis]
MKPILLSLLNIAAEDKARLNAHYEIIEIKNLDEASMLSPETLARVTALYGSATKPLSLEFLEALPNLQVISSFGVGYDPYDEDYIRRRQIRLGYTPDVLNDCVADLAMALMLDVARQVSVSDRYVRAGRWLSDGPYPLGVSVTGKRLGILGMGRIGLEIAARAKGFRMQIYYHNRNPRQDLAEDYHYIASPIELAKAVDYLIVATPATAETEKIVNQQVLEALGPQSYLINIARGAVVDEAALVKALQNKTIAGAGLDVFVNEPQVPEALFALDNVVITPHVASATVETRNTMRELSIQNFLHFAEFGEVKVAVPWAQYGA